MVRERSSQQLTSKMTFGHRRSLVRVSTEPNNARIMYRFAYGPYKSTGRVQLPVRVNFSTHLCVEK